MSETVDSSPEAIAEMAGRLEFSGLPEDLAAEAAALLAQVARERDEAIDFGSRLMVEVLDHCGVAYRGDDEFERLELIETLAAHNREFDRETARAAAAERQLAEARAALAPFANIALIRDDNPTGPDAIDVPDLAITPKHVLKARAVINGEPTASDAPRPE